MILHIIAIVNLSCSVICSLLDTTLNPPCLSSRMQGILHATSYISTTLGILIMSNLQWSALSKNYRDCKYKEPTLTREACLMKTLGFVWHKQCFKNEEML